MPTLTIRQIQWACNLDNPVNPKKKGCVGAKPLVTDEQKAALEAFLKEKHEHRLIPWIELPYWVLYNPPSGPPMPVKQQNLKSATQTKYLPLIQI